MEVHVLSVLRRLSLAVLCDIIGALGQVCSSAVNE